MAAILNLPLPGAPRPPFRSPIAPRAGLRNHLVHEYDVIDPAKVRDALERADHIQAAPHELADLYVVSVRPLPPDVHGSSDVTAHEPIRSTPRRRHS